MTIAELIAELKDFDPTRVVVMAKDAEGNNYSPLSSLWAGAYRAETTWYGDVGFEPGNPVPPPYTEEDICHGGQPAVILCPVN